MRRIILLACLALVAAGLLPPGSSQAQMAQGGRLCFNVPGVRECIEGRFRQYWEQNGGLAVFGYPISPPTAHMTPEGTFMVQTFERSRFELHPKGMAPYDVLLTRLGDERLKGQGRNADTFPKGTQKPGCLFFAQTGHSVCNQEGNVGFKNYWETHGLLDPKLNPFGRSLALFGLPLSEATMEMNASGAMVLTQWFERARFEFHPGNPSATKVLLGLLGVETQATLPPPGGPCNNIAIASGATISQNCVKAGASFTVEVSGFLPNQDLMYWITDEAGFTLGDVANARADAQGRYKTTVDTRSFSGVVLKPGNYTFLARDVSETFLPAMASFRVIP